MATVTVSGGSTYAVSSGNSDIDDVVLGGGTMIVDSGGSTSETVVDSGGMLVIVNGGLASSTSIYDGASEYVSSGGTAIGTTFGSDGDQDVRGTVIDTTFNGNSYQEVDAGGTAIGTTLNSGDNEYLYDGTTTGTVINSGGTERINGGVASGTVINSGGYELVEDQYYYYGPGTATDTTIDGGTLEYQYGTSAGSGSIIFAGSGGRLQIDSPSLPTNGISGFGSGDIIDLAGVPFDSGGSLPMGAGNVLQITETGSSYQLQFDPSQNFAGQQFEFLPDPGGGTEVEFAQNVTVPSGQTVSGTAVLSGYVEDVYGTALGAQVGNGGSLVVESGGSVSGTFVGSGASEVIESGGIGSGTTVRAGGYEFVASGGTLVSALVSGQEVDYGTTLDTVVNSGVEYVEVGGTALDTTVSSGTENVSSGATAVATTFVSGGYQAVGGTAIGTTFGSDGDQDVRGTVIDTTFNGNSYQEVDAGGTAIGTTLNSGDNEYLYDGTTTGTVINSGGTERINGGVASGTVINSGGYELVEDQYYYYGPGTATDTTIDGGTLEYQYGTSAGSGSIIFAGSGGRLQIDSPSLPTNGISGFGSGDIIDLAGVPFDSGGSLPMGAGNVLQITETGSSYQLQFDPSQNFAGQQFEFLPDPGGGTEVEFAQNVTVPSGQTVSGTAVLSGYVEDVYGTALGAQVGNGGSLVVESGGSVSGTFVGSGASEVIESGGIGSGTTVRAGGYEFVASGGTLVSALVSGQEVDYGTTLDTVVNSGVEYVEVGGTALDTTVSSGTENVSSGGITLGTTVMSGTENVSSGGTAVGTTFVSGGYQSVVGTVIDTTFNGNSYQEVDAGGTAIGTTLNSGDNEYLYDGTTTGTVINSGGTERINGGVASGTVINSGGYELVEDQYYYYGPGTATDTTIDGGTLEYQYGTSAGSGSIIFAGSGGRLQIDSPSLPTNGISGFGSGDIIDLAGVPFDSGGSLPMGAGNVLQITETGSSYQLQFDPSQNFAGQQFEFLPDPGGGTEVEFAQNVTVPSGQTVSGTAVLSGYVEDVYGTALGAQVGNGGSLVVESGGSVSGTFVGSGASEVIESGGIGSGTTVRAGGYEFVASGGTLVSALVSGQEVDYGTTLDTVVNSGVEYVEVGGTALDTTVSSGTENVSSGGIVLDTTFVGSGNQNVGGTALDTTFAGGGNQNVGGTAVDTAFVSGGYQSVVGTVIDTTFNGNGYQAVNPGGTAIGTTLNSGDTEYVYEGTTTGTVINSGSTEYIAGGEASGTVINSGGYELVEYYYYLGAGEATDTTIDGGTLEYQNGASPGSGPIIFAGSGGRLQIDSPSLPANGISGFGSGDIIDLAGVPFDSGGSLPMGAGNVLQITETGSSYQLQFDPLQNFANDTFAGVARLVGIEGGVVSGVFNLESSDVGASDRRPRHDDRYHEA